MNQELRFTAVERFSEQNPLDQSLLLAPSIPVRSGNRFRYLSYSNAASVRANEVLDCLSIPRYGYLQIQPFPFRSSCVQYKEAASHSQKCCDAPVVHFWASTKRLCNEWHAAERSPASKLGIFGAFVRPLSTIGSPQDSPGSPKTT